MSTPTAMKCPVCSDPVDEHPVNEEDPTEQNDLYVMEDVFDELMTYDGVVSVFKCHSDHTFYMAPSEVTKLV